MTAPETSPAGQVGEALPAGDHHLTEAHWQAAADAVTTGGTEADIVRRVAHAIADTEDRVRYGSAFCPDCGARCDIPHRDQCPTGLHDHEESHSR